MCVAGPRNQRSSPTVAVLRRRMDADLRSSCKAQMQILIRQQLIVQHQEQLASIASKRAMQMSLH